MYLKIKKGLCTDIYPQIYDFGYESDDFQKHSYVAISKDENVLVTAPTGCGKTDVAKYATVYYTSKGKTVVYTSPIKTLSNQKYDEFKTEFTDISVGLMTGDNKINPTANLVVMTTEILRNALYDVGVDKQKKKDQYFEDSFIDSVGCVIFDEVHYINDPDRGRVWEETINMLNPNITLVMLSATVNNPERFATWIGDLKQKPINLISTNHRVVPLEHFLFWNNKLYRFLDSNNKFYTDQVELARKSYNLTLKTNKHIKHSYLINNIIKYLIDKELLQTIFFSFSRKNCERYAKFVNQSLVTADERREIETVFNAKMHLYEKQYQRLNQYQTVKNLMLKGVCFHHSGLLPVLKEIIELIFQKGLIKILFATETFSVGVNMPTRTVVFTELEKHTTDGRRSLQTAEYRQMSGRAGRRGKDKFGYVIVLPLYDFPYTADLKETVLSSLPQIRSKFYIDYSFILKINQCTNIKYDQFINGSLFKKDSLTGAETCRKQILQLKEKIKIKSTDDLKYELEDLEHELFNLENYTDYESEKIKLFLQKFGYIDSVKGVIAYQINECNPLILTEMIVNNCFDDLEPEEIVGLLAIFINDKVSEDDVRPVIKSDKILDQIQFIEDIVEQFVQEELNLNIDIHCYGFYDLFYDWVETARSWSLGSDYTNINNVYEGNFIKNMLKINSIAKDVSKLSYIYGNFKVLPKLEKIEQLIVRDIVSVESLHL